MKAPEKRPTLADIARAGCVSRMSVSLALRNHPSLPIATRARLQEIARALGYRPNPMISALMRSLRARRMRRPSVTLAYVTAFPTRDGWRRRPMFRRAFEGAQHRADQLGYRLEEFWLSEPGMNSPRLSQILRARGICGVLIAPLPRPRGHCSLDWDQFASATIGYSLLRPSLHRAENHQARTMQLALRRLAKLGYRRPGLVLSERFDARGDYNWSAAFLARQHRLAADGLIPPLIVSEFSVPLLRKWFRRHRPDVVLSGDLAVFRSLRTLSRGQTAPVGFVHLEWSSDLEGIAGVRQNAWRVGAAAVDLVVEQLEHGAYGIPDVPKTVLIEGEWIDGPTARALTAA